MFKDTEVNLQNKHHVLYSFFSHISAGLSLKTEIYIFLYVYVVFFFCCLVFVLLWFFFFFPVKSDLLCYHYSCGLIATGYSATRAIAVIYKPFFSPFPSLATLEKSVCASRLFCMV